MNQVKTVRDAAANETSDYNAKVTTAVDDLLDPAKALVVSWFDKEAPSYPMNTKWLSRSFTWQTRATSKFLSAERSNELLVAVTDPKAKITWHGRPSLRRGFTAASSWPTASFSPWKPWTPLGSAPTRRGYRTLRSRTRSGTDSPRKPH
jgi:hypothetical protein